jgi:hypothetical protein
VRFFRKTVGLTIRPIWDFAVLNAREEMEDPMQPLTLAAVNDAFGHFILNFVKPSAYQKQLDYFRNIKKPFTMAVQVFKNRLDAIFILSHLYPHAPEDMEREDQEKRSIFDRACQQALNPLGREQEKGLQPPLGIGSLDSLQPKRIDKLPTKYSRTNSMLMVTRIIDLFTGRA